ncbi:MAG: mRNA surveillance protein pelota [Methanomicrobiales archaeon]|nr:mRNA surveillance protein pelota [Methanomicrobiales archaeon]
MKAESGEMRGNYGEIRLFAECVDDLWHLSHLVSPGDLVFATTLRSVDLPPDRLRPEKAEKRPVRLGIRVEEVSFHPYASRLRIFGVIEHGPDRGEHHTFNLEAGEGVSVIRPWRKVDLDRIDRAVKASVAGLVHVIAVEEGEAAIFRIRQYGPEPVASFSAGSGKGEGATARSDLFARVRDVVASLTGTIVVAGPGFVKDEMARYLKEHLPDVRSRITVTETRRAGRGAVADVIGMGVLETIAGDLQLKHEVGLMEELLARIAKGTPAAYGHREVEEAVSLGAVEQLLVSDTMLRDPQITRLMEQAERTRATVTVFSSEFDPGHQLEGLGGIAALLRFPLK